MKARVAINSFGRIGRMFFRSAILDDTFEIVAINASYPAENLAHMLKYDSVHGKFQGKVEVEENAIIVNGKRVQLLDQRDPKLLPWKELNIDIVIEATGKFNSKDKAIAHIEAGAKKVIITAPAKGEDVTIVMGVNDEIYDHETHHVISNASCTTNCLAPVVKVLNEQFGIENGLMTTVHAYTNDQKNVDNPHKKDLRRARACAQSIIPTSTGAAKAIATVMPEMAGKLHGMALRVPTPNVSLVDLVVDLKREVTAEEVNNAFRKAAAEGPMKGILGITDEPLVSIDFTTDDRSGIVDALSTMVIGGKKLKVLVWYDNEWGYSSRVVDLARLVAKEIEKAATVTVS
ncbi:glyceraldehyde-3-phosphate dehydrogenase, type I [Schinkia azotoformans MEV2011]|uniref:Glyceraldehyde-3-phosphate dehydrogenase n=2 Tax=Schinkia azotoformans TaxID=1454 RepID=K6DHA3_SCHAZ|nr:glyceraldehyde-3-phosphate dehydrogenase [Schinkia azotoformans]EKN67468.1 glyceraldehyde-3-phosphate dehydrogenase [Schinkia azotoformans LMG 9581]KEF39559.1 glyceraldehyde-3-phosphate dehydrogenase, type I [Schinkia azotoformans MEV2011]MEC1637753.1 glyceraldehyde-3-phosphate dehydrogenase [Schinkia azotoformans]MEC1694249.1 glyceraldehyde-3-phosphate dehydrogenase [Schinkia azotoformans]MEC1714950.1 glyceraldehyde-3-phosphate dehydrogenase [Schinkia azotoformans]